jgi:hypothetical protein
MEVLVLRCVAVSAIFVLAAAAAACGNVEESPSSEPDAAAPGDPDAGPPGEADASVDAVPVRRFALTVNVAGNGIVTSDPSGIVCGEDCSEELDETQSVTLTVLPGANAAFVGWDGDGCEGAAPTCTVTMSQARTITATFKVGYTLTVAKEGSGAATIASDPAGIDCGDVCQAGFDENTRVTLTAAHGADAAFKGWGGDDNGCSDSSLTCVITLDRARQVIATLTAIFRLSLTVTGNGTVTATLAGGATSFSCNSSRPCTRDYEAGTVVTLTAAPGGSQSFKEWRGACAGASTTCTVTLSEARTVTAAFVPLRTLSVSVVRPGTAHGVVRLSAPGHATVECVPGTTCVTSFPEGTTVSLVAAYNPSYLTFVSWSGSCTGAGSSTTCTLTMDGDRTATATYKEEYILAVHAVTAGASIRINAGGNLLGICETSCEYKFAPGFTVTLTAIAPPCMRFDSWYASWSATANPVTVTMNEPKSGASLFASTCN